MSRDALYRLASVSKEFEGPTEPVRVLRKVDLTIERGESLAVLGASGSGKTTLLHILGTLDTVTSGEILLNDVNLNKLGERQRAELRNRDIGFVFQSIICSPSSPRWRTWPCPESLPEKAAASPSGGKEALGMVGLEHRMEHKVTTLSGGERQRAAIARAILLRPRVLLADEPTGNLDEESGSRIGDLLVSLNKELGMTFVVVTHNPDLAGLMHRRVELRLGELYDQ